MQSGRRRRRSRCGDPRRGDDQRVQAHEDRSRPDRVRLDAVRTRRDPRELGWSRTPGRPGSSRCGGASRSGWPRWICRACRSGRPSRRHGRDWTCGSHRRHGTCRSGRTGRSARSGVGLAEQPLGTAVHPLRQLGRDGCVGDGDRWCRAHHLHRSRATTSASSSSSAAPAPAATTSTSAGRG
jgi:hypothetical protein